MEEPFSRIRGLINDLTLTLSSTIIHIDNLLLTLDRDCEEFDEAWLANGQLEQALTYFIELRSIFLTYQEYFLYRVGCNSNNSRINLSSHKLHELLTVLNIASDLLLRMPGGLENDDIIMAIKTIIPTIDNYADKVNQLQAKEFSLGDCNNEMKNVLLVDDDRQVRNVLNTALITYGFNVSCCETGEQATVKFNTHGNNFIICVLDINLPDTNGLILAKSFILQKPYINILLISGEGDHNLRDPFMLNVNYRLLQKPFSLSIFLETINNIINKV